jgi:hypothetical protein|tara:strand:- start:1758 stop:1913 length:156 start_codon:yes stop_codon:yes gene_type:complete
MRRFKFIVVQSLETDKKITLLKVIPKDTASSEDRAREFNYYQIIQNGKKIN